MWWFKKPNASFRRIPLETAGHLFVSAMPYGPYDKGRRVFRYYRKSNVHRVVVLVTDDELQRKARREVLRLYEREGMRVDRFPIKDLTSPEVSVIDEAVPRIAEFLRRENVAVHCNAGVGRTGVVTSCVVRMIKGWDGETALAYLKEHIEVDLTSEQKRLVLNWQPQNFS